MFNATTFSYDGWSTSEWGLVIADFDASNVVETEAFSPTLSLLKVPGQLRFFYGKVEYESAPSCEFSIVKEHVGGRDGEGISAEARAAIMSWLVGRNSFLPLTFHSGDNEDYTYYCVFTSVKTIWVNGRCFGFRLTAEFDSPFARGNDDSIVLPGGTHTVSIQNRSSLDDYVYPIVEFTGGSIDIVNNTDDSSRHFTFSGLNSLETVTVDNELNTITSTRDGEKLSCFTSKKWLRLRRGSNELTVTCPGEVTIKWPHYAMLGY